MASSHGKGVVDRCMHCDMHGYRYPLTNQFFEEGQCEVCGDGAPEFKPEFLSLQDLQYWMQLEKAASLVGVIANMLPEVYGKMQQRLCPDRSLDSPFPTQSRQQANAPRSWSARIPVSRRLGRGRSLSLSPFINLSLALSLSENFFSHSLITSDSSWICRC